MHFPRISAPSRAAARLLELGLLLITPLLFYRGFSEQFTSIKLFLMEGLILAGGLGLALGMTWGVVRWPGDFRLGAPLALLAAAVVLSCLASPLPAFSFAEAQAFLCGPLWLLLLAAGKRGEGRVRWLGALVTIAAAAVAVIALLQGAGYDPLQFGGYHVEWGTLRRVMRMYSTLGNPNFVSGYLIGAVFMATALAATVQKRVFRILGSAAVFTILGAVLATRSRGAWLGLVAGLWVAWRMWNRAKPVPGPSRDALESVKQGGLAAWILPAGLILFLPGLSNQAKAIVAQMEGRIFLARASWPMYIEHPLLGSGWGTFQLRFPDLQALFLNSHPEYVRYWTHTSQLHNDPLQILLEAGAVGFVALGWLVWRYGGEVREAVPPGSGAMRFWLAASSGGVTAILVDSLVNFQLAVPPTLLLLFTLLAVPRLLRPYGAAATGEASAKSNRARMAVLRILASGVALGFALICALGLARHVAAEYSYAGGMEAERRGDVARAEQQFRAGLEQTPEDGRLHYGLARSLYVQGRYPDALAEVLRAEATVADSHLEVLKARILDQMGHPLPALESYRHSLWLNPTLQSVPADIERLSIQGARVGGSGCCPGELSVLF